MPDDAAPPGEPRTSTIEICSGPSERTSRVELKRTMSVFGEVDVCHMGVRGQDYPFVRYKSQAAAEAAFTALKNGQVTLDCGTTLDGNWKTGGSRRIPAGLPPPEHRRHREMADLTSRNLIQRHRGGRSESSRSSSRRRSPSRRRRKRSRSRRAKRRRSGSRERQKFSAAPPEPESPKALTNGPSLMAKAADVPAPKPAHSAATPRQLEIRKDQSTGKVLEGDDAKGYANPLFMRRKRTS